MNLWTGFREYFRLLKGNSNSYRLLGGFASFGLPPVCKLLKITLKILLTPIEGTFMAF